jgi:hypothetical protein
MHFSLLVPNGAKLRTTATNKPNDEQKNGNKWNKELKGSHAANDERLVKLFALSVDWR